MTMTLRCRHICLIALMTSFYLLVALPLPFLLVDHYSSIAADDPEHSAADIHVWLEWAAGASLSGAALVLASAPLPAVPLAVVQVFIPSVFLASALRSRGPPITI
jgi:hypothetical protein